MEQIYTDTAAEVRLFDGNQLAALGSLPIDDVIQSPDTVDQMDAADETATPTCRETAELVITDNSLQSDQPPEEPKLTPGDIELIYSEKLRQVQRVIFRSIRDWPMSQQLTQDTFVKAYDSLQRGADVTAKGAMSWLFRIATNTVIDYVRRRDKFQFLQLEEEHGDETEEMTTFNHIIDPHDDYTEVEREHNPILTQALEMLRAIKPDQYECVILYHHLDVPIPDIARRYGVSEDAIKMRLMRGRNALKHRMATLLGVDGESLSEAELYQRVRVA